jgi:acyl-CoA synthetase (AMP-forming)/AMP-acid ligase II
VDEADLVLDAEFPGTLPRLALTQGATMAILPRFDPGSFLAAVEDYSVTRAAVVTPLLLALLNSERVDSFDSSSLRVLASAGAPLPPDLARACARLGCRVKQEFGMTECGGTHAAPDDGPDIPDSIGPALPGVERRVVDPETNADTVPGEPGELLVRSPSVMRGYLGDPEATAAAIDADGWLHTGDIVAVNDDGWFFVTGESTRFRRPPRARTCAGIWPNTNARPCRGARACRDLTGAVVLVSGGGRGLGRLLARTLELAGATVGLLARSRAELDDAVAEVERAGGRAAAVIADVTDDAMAAATTAELHQLCGPIDVLVNNAGVSGPIGPMWEVDPADWWRTFEVSLRGTSNLATSKAALVKLTENLAAETCACGRCLTQA